MTKSKDYKQGVKDLMEKVERMKEKFDCRFCNGKLKRAWGMGKVVFKYQCKECNSYRAESEHNQTLKKILQQGKEFIE